MVAYTRHMRLTQCTSHRQKGQAMHNGEDMHNEVGACSLCTGTLHACQHACAVHRPRPPSYSRWTTFSARRHGECSAVCYLPGPTLQSQRTTANAFWRAPSHDVGATTFPVPLSRGCSTPGSIAGSRCSVNASGDALPSGCDSSAREILHMQVLNENR